MRTSKLFLTLFFFCTLFINCESDDNSSSNSGDTVNDHMGSATTRDFFGQIVDENNNPIAHATIIIGNSTEQTDNNGIFVIDDAAVYENFAHIKATKPGYLDGSRAMIPTSGRNNVKIMLLNANVVATVTSGNLSEATLPNGTKVKFDGNFQTESGAAYSGSVSVVMHYLDPADPDFAAKMPGMLLAENEQLNVGVLETYGMINVELRGSGDQKLQLGGTAEIHVPVSNAQSASAPMSIPLWHFDEEAGYWKEEGSATKQGGFYVGTVTHFSWWNCDVYFPNVNLTIALVDVDGNPVPNQNVQLFSEGSLGNSNQLMTDSNGQVSGLIPTNQALIISVMNEICSTIFTSSIGPFTANSTITVTVDSPTVSSVEITGQVQLCDDNAIGSYVFLTHEGFSVYQYVGDGPFSFHRLICSNSSDEFTISASNSMLGTSIGPINYTFTGELTTVGNIYMCGVEFVSFQVDDLPVQNITTNITANSVGNGFSIHTQNGFYVYDVTGVSKTPGGYTTPDFEVVGTGILLNESVPNDIILQLSSFGDVGEYIDLTFHGNYTDGTGTHTITGVAHVLRDN